MKARQIVGNAFSVLTITLQSDSESDVGAGNNRGWNNQTGSNRISGLMRPTISSQNKINHQAKSNSSSNSNLPSVLRRRGMQGAYSSGNYRHRY